VTSDSIANFSYVLVTLISRGNSFIQCVCLRARVCVCFMQTVFRCFRQQDGVKEPLRVERARAHTHTHTHTHRLSRSFTETRAEESQSVSVQYQSSIMDLRGSHSIGMILLLYLIFHFITGSISKGECLIIHII